MCVCNVCGVLRARQPRARALWESAAERGHVGAQCAAAGMFLRGEVCRPWRVIGGEMGGGGVAQLDGMGKKRNGNDGWEEG